MSDVNGIAGRFREAMRMAPPAPVITAGYVVASLSRQRSAFLTHASVMGEDEAQRELLEWARRGYYYTLCEVRVVPP